MNPGVQVVVRRVVVRLWLWCCSSFHGVFIFFGNFL